MEPVTTADHNAPKTRAFLAAIRVCPSISRAAAAAGINPTLHYRRVRETDSAFDPIYKAAFEEAKEEGIGALEDAAVEYGVIGYNEPVIYQGRLQYTVVRDENDKVVLNADGEAKLIQLTVRKPNPMLHLACLRAAKPEKWSHRHEVTGKDGGPIDTTLTITFVKAKPE